MTEETTGVSYSRRMRSVGLLAPHVPAAVVLPPAERRRIGRAARTGGGPRVSAGLQESENLLDTRRFLNISRPVALGYHRDSLAATLTQAAIRTRWSLPFDAKKGSASLRSASAPGLAWAGTNRWIERDLST